MGQKVNPNGLRLGINREHTSIWYANKKNYADYLLNDLEVRAFLMKHLKDKFVSRVEISRPRSDICVNIHTARPGIVIGQKGADIDRLRMQVSAMMNQPVKMEVVEIRKPELDAYLAAQNIAQQLEKRVQFRRAVRRVITNAIRQGAEGIKVRVAGRLNGVEIARAETFAEGRVPLHTLRADIDYAVVEAMTTYGTLGVKVWIFKGEILDVEAPTARGV